MSVSYGGDKITFDDGTSIASGLSHFRNRIINGAMEIDQRNAGAAVSTSGSYPVDRFYVTEGTSATFTSQRSTTVPTGFTNSLLFTVGTGASAGAAEQVQIRQQIEGFNIADLAWGTASAKSVTISFQVRSSVTGTYCVFLQSSDGGVSYVATYTISSANTFESKSITITGPTSGTFYTDNSTGVMIGWDLGSGSNFNTTADSWQSGQYRRTTGQANFISNSNATFYITGVQLEVGSYATTFERRPYGTELALCQRYLPAISAVSGTVGPLPGIATALTTNAQFIFNHPVPARVPGTGVTVSNTGHFNFSNNDGNSSSTAVSFAAGGTNASQITITVAVSRGATTTPGWIYFNNASGFLYITGCEL